MALPVETRSSYVDITTKFGIVHVHESSDGIIVDVWRDRYDEPVYTVALDKDALDPYHRYPPEVE